MTNPAPTGTGAPIPADEADSKQVNTAVTTDGFKNSGDDATTAPVAKDGANPATEGDDQQKPKDAAAPAEQQQQGGLRAVLGRLKKGSDEPADAHGQAEEAKDKA
ncbi:hypothetical protein SAMD00023353_3100480 [Rosellinia necatrix]|uniref:Uncharacterized protein n=1 Tax=Rosellinia necatrix TaxID=77044 RepID=A0A1W2TTZ8_ROSNE|nr:hypothetical protein SAMD00023353_3100480 [Rosellinia necatrix]